MIYWLCNKEEKEMKNTQTLTDINEWKISKRKQREMAFDEYIHALNKVSTLLEKHLETKHGILKIKY